MPVFLFLFSPTLFISQDSPSIYESERIPATKGSVTWQPSQKASMPVTQQGAGIYFSHPPPCFILEAPSPTQEPKRNLLSLLSQLPPSSWVKKTIFHKQEKENFLSFCLLGRPKGAVYCTPLHDACLYTHGLFLMEGEKSVKPCVFLLCR